MVLFIRYLDYDVFITGHFEEHGIEPFFV